MGKAVNGMLSHTSGRWTRSVALAFGLLTVVATWTGVIDVAKAGGYEWPGGSARAIGRGSTGLARADDPIMALLNPAAAGSMPSQLYVGINLAWQGACIDQPGTVDPGYTDGEEGIENPKICNGINRPAERSTLLPLVGGVVRLGKRGGLLFGLDPPFGERRMIWEQTTTEIDGVETPGFYEAPPGVDVAGGLLPSSGRYMLVRSDVIVVHATFGFGVKLADWLQIGAGFGYGFGRAKFITYTRFLQEGTDPAGDTPTDVTATDWFMPRAVGSIHFIPHDSVDIMAGFRWDDDFRGSGSLTADTVAGEATGSVSYRAPQPLWITFGIRYAKRTAPRAKLDGPGDGSDDPMLNETFDLELDVIYERNRQVDNHYFQTGDLTIVTGPDSSIVIPAATRPAVVPHRWKDQVSIRFGGDYNVMPGKLALRLGTSYETNGFREGYGFIDYLPMQRFGIHAGLSGRFGRVELSVGYVHFFTTTFNNPNGLAPQIVVDLEGPVDDVTVTTNSGTYTAHVDMFGWSIRAVFD